MGGRIDLPRGVTLREFAHETRIQIAFSYKGECRELLPPCNITKSAINYAAGLRAEIQRKIADGTFRYSDYFPESPRAKLLDVRSRHVVIGDLLDKQLRTYEKQVETGSLSPSTLDGYRKALNSERMSFWRDLKLDQATPSTLRQWIAELNVTAKFARNLMTPLRSVFEDALNDELIDFNPFDRIALTKLLKQTCEQSDYEVDPFSSEERDKIIKACRPDEWPTLLFWFNTGLRPGELQALRKDRIIGTQAKIDENQVAGKIKGPKTEAGIRMVDLNADALRATEAQKLICGDSDRLWLNPRTNEPWTTDSQLRKTLWMPLIKRSGVRYRNPYQARHTYASALLTADENPWYVAQQLGHTDVTMVFKIYGKFISTDYKKPSAPKLKVVSG